MWTNSTPPLLTGERILWQGKPFGGLVLRPSDAFLIPFSLLWGGFAIFWNAAAWLSDVADESFRLFGLPFLVAGLYVTIGRFLLDMHLRRRLDYVVTNRRVLISRRGIGAATKSLDISHLPALELTEHRNGSGTIRFGGANGLFGGNNIGIWQPTFDPTPQFIRIPNAQAVYAMIERQANG